MSSELKPVEAFKGVKFIVDTNVLLPRFAPKHANHEESFQCLLHLVKEGAELYVPEYCVRTLFF
jgi:predicted nucleic acid-binding protein